MAANRFHHDAGALDGTSWQEGTGRRRAGNSSATGGSREETPPVPALLKPRPVARKARMKGKARVRQSNLHPRRAGRVYEEVFGIVWVGVAAFGLLSLFSKATGPVGHVLSWSMQYVLGQAAWLPFAFLAYWGLGLLISRWRLASSPRLAGLLLLAVAGLVETHLQLPVNARLPEDLSLADELAALPKSWLGAMQTAGMGSGLLGGALTYFLVRLVAYAGTQVVVAVLAASGLVLVTEGAVLRWLVWAVHGFVRLTGASLREAATLLRGSTGSMADGRAEPRPAGAAVPERGPLPVRVALQRGAAATDQEVPSAAGAAGAEEPVAESVAGSAERQAVPAGPRQVARKKTAGAGRADKAEDEEVLSQPPLLPAPALVPRAEGPYQVPPLSLLGRRPPARKTVQNADQAQLLLQTLATFGIEARVLRVDQGPVITRYEVQPAPGIKVSRILSLTDDISLALAAAGVRIEAPIPGKSAIGVEVPNRETSLVHLRDVLDSLEFRSKTNPLLLGIGADIAGQPVVADLAKMPHLLIAGATGSGKSVCMNTLISSLLFRSTPDTVRLLMIDPKRVELTLFDGIPHLVAPVIPDARRASGALRALVEEMERRYQLFVHAGVRNIEAYNEWVKEMNALSNEPAPFASTPDTEAALGPGVHAAAAAREPSGGRADQPAAGRPEGAGKAGASAKPGAGAAPARTSGESGGAAGQVGDTPAPVPEKPLPYIVVFVDELADLMMVAAADVEESIVRLAQMARAAGIHLVIATQRPSVDVITGLIKANIPSRIAFAVSSQVDSRTILDQAGAERLLGRGDMLFLPAGAIKARRVQGAFITDREVENLVAYWRRQGPPQYMEEFLSSEEALEGPEVDDDLFEDAVRVVVESGQASASLLQRRLRVGYARAARLVDLMEMKGIVGPSQGSKPREVLVGRWDADLKE
ncbi:MAG: DUF87 domain-containing protein [Firmicutes bacterium]|nr:DUF87 domain-containing protein [Bacillota bacterium]